MAGLLSRLSPELISALCAYLDSSSLGRLRLVSQACKSTFAADFLGRLGTQNVDLTSQGLQRLCRLASSQELRRGVRVLNLTCLYYHQQPSRELLYSGVEVAMAGPLFPRRPSHPVLPLEEERKQDEMWMAEKEAEQAALSGAEICELLSRALHGFDDINTITLEGIVVRRPGLRYGPEVVSNLVWRRLWTRAIQAFRIVMSAVARSQVSLSTLAIFHKTKKCSIPTNEVTADLLVRIQEEGFEAVGRGIKSLSIGLATTVVPLRPCTEQMTRTKPGFYEPFDLVGGRKLTAGDARIDTEAKFDGVVGLLRLMPCLESLDIHLCNSTETCSTVPGERPFQFLLQTLFQSLSLSRLECLALQGLPTSEQTLTEFFSQHPQLRALTLRNMFLVAGSWTQVLASAVHVCTSLTRVQLCNLWLPGNQGPLHLEGRGPAARRLDPSDPETRRDWFGPARRRHVWYSRTFTKGEIPELADIGSEPTVTGPLFMSGNTFVWMLQYNLEIGPP